MKNVFILPTEEHSRIILKGDELFLSEFEEENEGFSEFNQNIYITSNEKPKEGDWVFDTFKNACPIIRQLVTTEEISGIQETEFKIILTTSLFLIEDGVQGISTEFLQWFIKNPACEFVEVENEVWDAEFYQKVLVHKIIIPKQDKEIEEYYLGKTLKLKKRIPSRCYKTSLQESEIVKIDKFIDGTVDGCRVAVGYKYGFEFLLFNTTHAELYISSNFEIIDEPIIPQEINEFMDTRNTLIGQNTSIVPQTELVQPEGEKVELNCIEEAILNNGAYEHESIMDTDPLQEIPGTNPDTLKAVLAIKEAAEKHFLEKYSWTGVNHLPYREEDVRLMKEDFIAGAKYQAKRMYSEQEVRKIVWESRKFFHGYDNTPFSQIRNGFNNWFEKFKKK